MTNRALKAKVLDAIQMCLNDTSGVTPETLNYRLYQKVEDIFDAEDDDDEPTILAEQVYTQNARAEYQKDL